MEVVDFINEELLEKKAYELFSDFIHDWATYVSPKTMSDHVDTIPCTESRDQHATLTVSSAQENWVLTCHLPLLSYWGTGVPLHGERRDEGMLQPHMDLYHPSALRWLNCITYYFLQEESTGRTFLPTFTLGKNEAKKKPLQSGVSLRSQFPFMYH